MNCYLPAGCTTPQSCAGAGTCLRSQPQERRRTTLVRVVYDLEAMKLIKTPDTLPSMEQKTVIDAGPDVVIYWDTDTKTLKLLGPKVERTLAPVKSFTVVPQNHSPGSQF